MKPRQPVRGYLRLLPVTVAVAALVLAVRAGELWFGLELDPAPAAFAEESGEDKKKGESGAKTEMAENKSSDGTDTDSGDASAVEALGEPRKVFDLTLQYTPEEIAILQDLGKRREEIEAREIELEDRARLLDAAEGRLESRIAELKTLRTSIESLIRQYDDQEQAELQSVVKIYEAMKPKDAARILGELELEILLGILENMKERKMAPILAAMEPERARDITAEMARRRAIDLSTVAPPAEPRG